MKLESGKLISGRYRLIRQIGVGGFSVVWLVADELMDGHEFALKVYAPDRGLDDSGLRQFQREYLMTVKLNHPNLLKATHYDIFEGSPYLVMTFCEKGSVSGLLEDKGNFDEEEIASLLLHVARGLSYLHEQGLIHQDIKPDNILIEDKERFLLTDFGISSKMRSTLRKNTDSGNPLTIAYSPPERFRGTQYSGVEGDIFSLGVMIFELATGYLPWNGLGGRVLSPEMEPPELPLGYSKRLEKLMQWCIAYHPKDRPSSKELLSIVEHFKKSGCWPEIPFSKVEGESKRYESGRKTEPIDTKSTEFKGSRDDFREQIQDGEKKQLKSQKTKLSWIIGALLVVSIFIFSYFIIENQNYFEEIEGFETEAAMLLEEGDYKAAYLKYLELIKLCKEDCEGYSASADSIALLSMEIHQYYLDSSDSLLAINQFTEAEQYISNAAYFHTNDWDPKEKLKVISDAKTKYEALLEEERQREQAERQRIERLLVSAKEMESTGDIYYRNKEYQKARDFYQQSLDFQNSDQVRRKKLDAEKRLPINIQFDFSREDWRFSDNRDYKQQWITEDGVLKGFSFNKGFSYHNGFQLGRLSEASFVEISLFVRHVRGADNINFGMYFFGDGTDPSQRFGISSNGSTDIGTYESKWNTQWEASSAIKKGSSVWNELKITYQSGRITYYVNGVQVKQASGKVFGNFVGVYFSGDIKEVWFDKLYIKATF